MSVVLDPAEPRQFDRLIQFLSQGLPVALPTETVYGLAGLALEEEALANIFALKARPHFDPLIVHVLGIESAEPLVESVGSLHHKLVQSFWPGPMTLLFKKTSLVPDLCTAQSPYVALRSPLHPVFRKVLESLGEPLAAPSANRFGRISPVCVQDVLDELGPWGLEAVVEGGDSVHGLESSVLKVHEEEQEIEIIRLGSLKLEEIRKVVGPDVHLRIRSAGTGIEEREAPGQLSVHYAPTKKLLFFESEEALLEQVPGLSLRETALVAPYEVKNQELRNKPWALLSELSPEGRDEIAAARLFKTLRHLDKLESVHGIVALKALPEKGLNLAINDRLRRASYKSK